MFKTERFNDFEKDLVNGYYRLKYNKYVTNEIKFLSMAYLYKLDKFEKSDDIKIEGVNQDMVKDRNKTRKLWLSESINHSNKPNENYYHWKFKINNCPDMIIAIGEDPFNFYG